MLRRLDPDGGVPLSGRQHRHRVQELVEPGQQVVPLLGLVRHVVEHLVRHDGGHGAPDLVVGRQVALHTSTVTPQSIGLKQTSK